MTEHDNKRRELQIH